jgi:hypothetical protein
MLVHRLAQLRRCLRGCMVHARLARVAQEPEDGDAATDPRHYSVVIMHYGGQPLTTLKIDGSSDKVMFVTRGVAASCLRLFENGFVYVDMKPANVVYFGPNYDAIRLSLCDYGALAQIGATDALATYPPPEHPYGTDVHANERAVVYGLGVLLVCLYTDDLEYELRFMNKSRSKKGEKAERFFARTGDAVLAMQVSCAKVLDVLRDRDGAIAALVELAWQPKTTLLELIAAIDRSALAAAQELLAQESSSGDDQLTPGSPDIRASSSELLFDDE